MKILILGATGFLGGLVTTRLARDGHQIVCLARKPGIQGAAANIEYVQATLDDAQAISENSKDADFLLHFAWDTTPGTSKGQPTVEAVNNLLPTFRLIEELQSVDNCQLIFVSSAGAVYDETGTDNVVETSPLNPKSYYGAGKSRGRKTVAQFFSPAGPLGGFRMKLFDTPPRMRLVSAGCCSKDCRR